MVDKAVFIGMSGAKSNMHQLEIVTNNLANANTVGFRADYEIMKQYNVSEGGQQSRTFGELDGIYTDFKPGPTLQTGRDLDIAVSGEGFIAVQSKSGLEGYTRAGDMQITKEGNVTTRAGELVMGIGGPLNIPDAERISIGPDGTVQARLRGTKDFVTINRIKLVNPPLNQITKGTDGLIYMKGEGATAMLDNNVKIIHGALEGSNVNTIETLTKLIDLSRNYESHTNMMKTVSDNALKANQLLNVPR